MAELDNIVNVDITVTSATAVGNNFGTPAILAYHTLNSDVSRVYTDTAGMLADGFLSTDPAYYMATSIVEQNPHASPFVVIRSSIGVTTAQTVTLTVTDTNVGDSVGITFTGASGGDAGVEYEIYTTTGGSTSTIASALAALPHPTGFTGTASGASVTFVASTPQLIFYPSGISGCNYIDNTALCPSIATDLTNAANGVNPFYSVTGAWMDRNNINAIATWVDANTRITGYTTPDTENITGTSAGIFKTLDETATTRAFGSYSATPQSYRDLGLMAQRFTANPGSDDWAYKTIIGGEPDVLTPTQIANIQANNGNFYTTVAGVPVYLDGRSAGGQPMDIQRGVDALANNIQINVFNVLISNPKVPYTSAGIAMIGSAIRQSLSTFVGYGFLSNDPGFQYQVNLPDISTISATDKKNRVLNNVTFTAYAAGAINYIKIAGTINF